MKATYIFHEHWGQRVDVNLLHPLLHFPIHASPHKLKILEGGIRLIVVAREVGSKFTPLKLYFAGDATVGICHEIRVDVHAGAVLIASGCFVRDFGPDEGIGSVDGG